MRQDDSDSDAVRRAEEELAALTRARNEARARLDALRGNGLIRSPHQIDLPLDTAGSSPARAADVGEGFDDPRLDTLFLTMPVSWKGTLIQYAGRIQRLHPAKREVRIYDYVDRAVPVLDRMFRRRLVPTAGRREDVASLVPI